MDVHIGKIIQETIKIQNIRRTFIDNNFISMKRFWLFFILHFVTSVHGQQEEISLSAKYFGEGKFDEAEKMMLNVLANKQYHLTKFEKISLHTDLGKIYTIKGDYSRSLQHLIQAKGYNRGDSLQYSHYNVAFGELFGNIGATSLSIEFYKKAYAIRGNHLARYYHANTIGCMFLKLNQPDSALYYFTSQLKSSFLLSDYIARASSLNNIAIAYDKKKEYDKALQKYLASKTILEQNKKKQSPNFNGEKESFYYSVIANIGKCYYSNGNYQTALPYLEKVYSYEKRYEINSRVSLAKYLVSTYIHLNKIEKANAVENSFSKDRTILNNEAKILLLGIQQEIALAENDTEKSKKLFQESQEVHLLLNQENIIRTDGMNLILSEFLVSEAKIKIDIEKRKKQQLERAITLKKRENQFIIALFVSIFILLIIIGLLYFQHTRNKRRKIQLEKEYLELEDEKHKLKIKAQESFLTEFAIENNLKKEYSKELLKNLNHLISLNDGEIKREIKNLIFELKSKELADKNVEELNDQSELLLINFKTKLSQIHPRLSKSDIELCCLIKLNLSNKEIALHKNVTDESVKIFKNRLKKKMNLDSSVNLNSYIADL